MNELKVNSHGTNAKFKFNILSDKEMRKIGFTDRDKDVWYFCRTLICDISFNVCIPKDGSEAWIDVLDEEFCQPYDWQYLLSEFRSPIALIVDHFVKGWMLYLQQMGAIENYCEEDYI